MGEERDIAHTGAAAPVGGGETAESGESSDGRTQRRERNREAVLQALIDLVIEGDLSPTVSKITERAGVSDRSLFRYFDDFADLSRKAFDREFARLLPYAVIDDLGEGDLAHRIEKIVESRIRVNSRSHAIARMARAQAVRNHVLEARLNELVSISRVQIKQQFEPELATMDDETAFEVVGAIVVALSGESYDLMVRQLDAAPDEIAGILRRTLHCILSS